MSIRPLKELKKVTLTFEFDVSDEYIERTIDEHGMRPSRRWAVTFDLADVPAAFRGRLRKAHALYMDVEPYPAISAPTEDPEEFLTAIEPWIKQASAEQKEEEARTEERDKEKAIANARFRMEMKEWVRVHGSPRLRAAVERNYKANTTYAMERAAAEMPGFWVDTAGDSEWGERSDPSEEALMLESKVQDRMAEHEVELDTRIVWLTETPRVMDRWLEEEDGAFEVQEAIVVSRYLGRYVLVMPIDSDLRRPQENS
jgi:hypothetical protein